MFKYNISNATSTTIKFFEQFFTTKLLSHSESSFQRFHHCRGQLCWTSDHYDKWGHRQHHRNKHSHSECRKSSKKENACQLNYYKWCKGTTTISAMTFSFMTFSKRNKILTLSMMTLNKLEWDWLFAYSPSQSLQFHWIFKISVSVNHVLSHQKNPGHVENEQYFQNRVVMKAISHFS